MSNPSDNTRGGDDGTFRDNPLPKDLGGKPSPDPQEELHDLASGSANSANDPTRAFEPSAESDFYELADTQPMPKKLGKYEIKERLGRGGMGVVLKAHDPDLHRTVAIKVLSPELAHSAVARRRFRREAQAVAAISHPNVLTIHSVEAEGETPFIVMEFVAGDSLRQYVDRHGKLTALEVVRLGTQIAMGLAAAHANGVIHRDVKPGNVMLHEGATRLRLMDFGLARVAFDNVELTSHDQCVGTPAYMAPEQVRGQEVDGRADLFSLGCVLYYMMTGFSPFQGKSPAETIHRILSQEPPPLDRSAIGASPVLAEIISKLLQKEPEQRYQSAQEVADIFRTLLAQLNLTPTDQIEEVLSDRDRARIALSKVPKRSLSYWGIATVIVVCLCVAGFLATGKFFSRETSASRPAPSEAPAKQDDSIGKSPSVPSKTGAAIAAVQPKLQRISVGPGGTCGTIAEAIERAAENCEIVVIGPGPFTESVSVAGAGLRGLKLRAEPRAVWRCPAANKAETHALGLQDVSNVEISGFEFEVAPELGRGINVMGRVGDVVLSDCRLRHAGPTHKLSLVNVVAERERPESSLVIRDCQFSASAGIGFCLAIDAKELPSPRVDCRGCVFQSDDRHFLAARSCSQLVLAGNVFLGGHTGLHFGFKPWLGEEQFLIHNNTFLGTRYWMSWMDSAPLATAVPQASRSRVCNNLILGGERTLGKPEQWAASIGNWEFAANFWERDGTTQPTADRDGRIASLHDRFEITERTDLTSPSFLVPTDGSKLLTSGVGGDLPEYVGAKSRAR